MQAHLTSQDQLVNYAIAFIALLVTTSQYLAKTSINLTSIVSLGSSIVFASLSLMFARYDVNIAICSGYITSILKPRIENLILQTQNKKVKILLWENENVKFRFSKKHAFVLNIYTIGRQGILVAPSIGILAFYIFNRDFTLQVSLWENVLLGISIIANINLLISLFYVVSLYAKGNPIFEASSK